MHPSVKVVGVPLERRGGVALESIEHLAATAMNYVSAFDMRTAVFYGHSMGGLVAFELCRQLIKDRRELPLKVILGGSAAPGSLPPDAGHLTTSSTLRELPQYIRDRTAAGVARSRAYAPPKQPIPVSLDLIHGVRDDLVSLSAMVAWEEYCAQSPRYHQVNGDHLFHRTSTEEFMSVLRGLIPGTVARPGRVAMS